MNVANKKPIHSGMNFIAFKAQRMPLYSIPDIRSFTDIMLQKLMFRIFFLQTFIFHSTQHIS